MNSSVESYQRRLRDEVSVIEHEIESHNQQIEALNARLEGLKRALELCDSEQPAVVELLRTGVPGLELEIAEPSKAMSSASRKTAVNRKTPMRRETSGAARNAQLQRSAKVAMSSGRSGNNGAMKRVDMIVAALKRHPRLTVRELMAALDREFGWKCGESNLTAHLYTNPDRFSHTKADRAGKQLVTWSLR
jgi:predicted RNase H-like nuclease (RuvC/YqgF family)